jgi:hypothetical protein
LDFGFRFMGRDPPQAQQSENRFSLSPGPRACDAARPHVNGRARRA